MSTNQPKILSEAKARIEHAEDLVFMHSIDGVNRTVMALKHVVHDPAAVTIKIDGSPALIFGRDRQGFTLTDKAGFSKPDGLPRTAQALMNMLYLRRPNDPGRLQFAQNVSSCWLYLEKLLPKDFQGYLQGDLLWVGRPKQYSNNWEFTPNKITYHVPMQSQLGQQIASSYMGIVIHSYFAQQYQDEPQAIDQNLLGLNPVPGVALLDCQLPSDIQLSWPNGLEKQINSLVQVHKDDIALLLSKPHLAAAQLSDFNALCKRFLAWRASKGLHHNNNLGQEFLDWVSNSPVPRLTVKKRANILVYASRNQQAFNAMWQIVSHVITLKHRMYQQLETHANQRITAYLRNKMQHEGFVADTPYGRIKLVNRAEFMMADE
jgi:hypothetical protein